MGFKTFNVVGVKSENRLELISKYVSRGSTFLLERDLENEYSVNAIKVMVVFRNGGRVCIGFVPDNDRKPLAKELAPLMDSGHIIKVVFGMKFLNDAGETMGLQLRYQVDEPMPDGDFFQNRPVHKREHFRKFQRRGD